MIQRKQTVFMLVAVVLMVVCMCMPLGTLITSGGNVIGRVYNLWIADGQGDHSFVAAPLFVCLLLSVVLTLANIFMYTRRKLQATLCLAVIMLLLAWGVLLAVVPQWMGGKLLAEWPAYTFVPVSIIMLFMAHKGIMADEKLVRSLDRIR